MMEFEANLGGFWSETTGKSRIKVEAIGRLVFRARMIDQPAK